MGYELIRFTSNVDEELQCSICTMVLEQPVQTRCEHFYCTNCIQQWLAVKHTCPLDGQPLTIKDLHPPSRLLRNLLSKLTIRCSYYRIGCCDTIRLDSLGSHCVACPFNPDAEVLCDKGCNLLMPRREYKANNCLAHYRKLVSQQVGVIGKLQNEIRLERTKKLNARKDVERLKATVKSKDIEIRKEQIEKFNAQREIDRLNATVQTKDSANGSLKYKKSKN